MHGKALFGSVLMLLALLSLALGACAQAQPSVSPIKRTIYLTALEYKGSTEVAKEPFPTAALPTGGGYILKEPVDGKWETSTYRWDPGVIVVNQGDEVELKIFGVNGKEHPASIEGYVPSFKVMRGQLTTVSFKADKVGTFKIVCTAHLPSMEGYLMVLPRT